MRCARVALPTIVALLVLGFAQPALAGTEERPDITDVPKDTCNKRVLFEAGEVERWADIQNGWIRRNGTNLLFGYNMSGHNPEDSEAWDGTYNIHFNVSQTGESWVVSMVWEDGELVPQLTRDGQEVADANGSISRVDFHYELKWHNFESYLPNDGVLEDLHMWTNGTWPVVHGGTDTEEFCETQIKAGPFHGRTTCYGEGVRSHLPAGPDVTTQSVMDCAPPTDPDGDGEDEGRQGSVDISPPPADDVGFALAPAELSAAPGAQRVVDVVLTSDTSKRIYANVSATLDGPFSTDFNHTNVTIRPDDVTRVPVNVTASPNASEGATGDLTVQLDPTNPRALVRTENAGIEVVPGGGDGTTGSSGLSISPSEPTVQVPPGSSASTELTVDNPTTAEVAVDLAITDGPGWAELETARTTIAAGASTTVGLTVDTPDDVPDGRSETVEIQATPDGQPSRAASTTLTVEVDAGDASGGSVVPGPGAALAVLTMAGAAAAVARRRR